MSLRTETRAQVQRNSEALVFHFPWHTGEPESVIRRGNFKLRKNLDSLDDLSCSTSRKTSVKNKISHKACPNWFRNSIVCAATYLESVNAETVTLTRRNYVELLEGGWIENGRKRLAKLKAELAADPDNKQKAFKVDVSQNHVDFQDRQLKRSTATDSDARETWNGRSKLNPDDATTIKSIQLANREDYEIQ